VTFPVYNAIYKDTPLTIAQCFEVITIFNAIQLPLMTLLGSFFQINSVRATALRLNEILKLEDYEGSLKDDQSLEKGELKIENGNYYWNKEKDKNF